MRMVRRASLIRRSSKAWSTARHRWAMSIAGFYGINSSKGVVFSYGAGGWERFATQSGSAYTRAAEESCSVSQRVATGSSLSKGRKKL